MSEAQELARRALEEGDRFEFRLSGGRGFILEFRQGRDVISLDGLGLTPWDLLPSISGADLVLEPFQDAADRAVDILCGGAEEERTEIPMIETEGKTAS